MRTSGRESDMGIVILSVTVMGALVYYLFGSPRTFLYSMDAFVREALSTVAGLFR